MTKQDFLIQLQRELNGKIGSQNAVSFVEYYQEYIEIELRKGQSVEEVMEKLRNPRLIACSITEVFREKEQKASKDINRGKLTAWIKGLAGSLHRKGFEKAREWFDHL